MLLNTDSEFGFSQVGPQSILTMGAYLIILEGKC